MKKADVKAMMAVLRDACPEPKSELLHANPFQLTISVVLSAQATDISVNKVTPSLFKKAPTPAAMRKLGVEGIIPFIRTIGLFNNKAKNIHALCGDLVERFDGEVPQTREELESLPGVGRKSANVILNVAFGQSTLAVDTHVFRVGNRTGLGPGKTPVAVERALVKAIPDEFMYHAHHWLILHGRYVCKARKPQCGSCPIETWCRYKKKNL